jgi:membrane peptidoglycan carboxypeptidase
MSEPRAAGSTSARTGLVGRWTRRRAAKKRRIAAMSRRRRILRRVGIVSGWLVGLMAATVAAAVILFYSLSDVPRPSSLPLPQVATILYSDGSVMARIGSVNRTIVDLDRVPKPVQWDVLAAEDRGFYSEPGVSITGTLRAGLSDVTGGDVEGGSGITQQYVKNAYLSDARTLTRKLKELAIAVKLTREYSKDQILGFYLNTVYFGRGAYGIEAGAQAFFGEDVSKLTVSQGAVLAALLRAPSYYDPAVNPGQAKARWRYVLDGMVATHHLTQAQADAQTFPKVRAPRRGNGLGISGPRALIVQRVIAELQAHGISENEIYARGLRIQTTIDKPAQLDAEHAISQTFANLTPKQRNIKNALVAVDPKTGAVLAYYGGPDGRDYAGRDDYYDYASLGFAAPGSSFKPYTLATALTQTLNGNPAKPLTISSRVNGSFCVTIQATKICNDPSDRPYSSKSVTVANAMKYSLNTTFDQMAQLVGPANVAALAHAAGVSKTIDGKATLQSADGQTSFGIGIGDYPVHPIDQAVGFATFANGGVSNAAYFVQKATASDGSVVYRHSADSRDAVAPAVANDVSLSLEPVAAWSGVPLADGRESAAKTGTEGIQGDAKGNNSDAWTVGYTPQVSAAVWVGSGNATSPIYDSAGQPEYGRDLPGHAWQAFMDAYLAGKPKMTMPSQQMVGAPHKHVPAPTASSHSAPSGPASPPPSSSSPAPSPPTTPPPSGSGGSSPPPGTQPPTPPPTSPSPSPSSPTPSTSSVGAP